MKLYATPPGPKPFQVHGYILSAVAFSWKNRKEEYFYYESIIYFINDETWINIATSEWTL